MTGLTLYLVDVPPLSSWSLLGQESLVSLCLSRPIFVHKCVTPIVAAAEDVIGRRWIQVNVLSNKDKFSSPCIDKQQQPGQWTAPVTFGQVWLKEPGGKYIF